MWYDHNISSSSFTPHTFSVVQLLLESFEDHLVFIFGLYVGLRMYYIYELCVHVQIFVEVSNHDTDELGSIV